MSKPSGQWSLVRVFLWLCLLSIIMLPILWTHVVNGQQEQSGARIESLDLSRERGNYLLSANISLNLGNEVRNAAERGVPLFFTISLEIIRPEKFWFDKTELSQRQTWRIQYNALLRQWRISTGDFSTPELSLDDSLQHIVHLDNWPLSNFEQLESNRLYEARLRLELDTSLLPRPFQINAFNSSAWSLSTPWKNLTFRVSDIKPGS
ncbi:MAG: DUF4390 domain-containing protein [Alcaligenaceae bacterium]|nr:DUF4390 domain-containing protein [Alcaligenaceae bacterium]